MTGPTPAPTPGAAATSRSVGGISIPVVTPGGAQTSSNRDVFKGYGFTVDLTGLFAGGHGVTTGDQALTDFENAARDTYTAGAGSQTGQFVAIQDALLKGGFYGTNAPSYGVLGPDDITAFQKFLVFAGQNYDAAVSGGLISDGQSAPSDLSVVGLLNSQASAGVQYGISAAARRRASSLSIIRHVNPDDSAAALSSAYKQLLGRDPTDAEKNAFQTAYDAQTVGPQEAAANAATRLDTSQSASAGFGSQPGLPGSGHVSAQVMPGPWKSGYIPQDQTNITSPQGTSDLTAPSGDLNSFMAAIGGQESGGNYGSVNPDTGASGKFQIMPSNWPSWAQQAGLGPNAPQTPQNQDAVAKYKMAQYFNQFHNWGAVAAAWYGGPSAGAAYLKDPTQGWLNRAQGGGKYPSITGYANTVLSRFGQSTIGSRNNYNADVTGPVDSSLATGPAAALPGAPGGDLNVVDAGSISAAAEAAAKSANPAEYGAHQIASTFSNFLSLLGGVA